MWGYRELLLFLAWRDLKVRYKQTMLGAAWAVLQPVLTMAVFGLVFGAVVRVPSDGFPYPIFIYCGLLPWQLFAFAMSNSANSLLVHERLVTKVYFPRLILPMSGILSGLVDFALSFVILLALMAYYGIQPSPALWALPAFVLFAVVAASAVGIGLAAINVRFRDVRHILPFVTQFWFLATPIAYPSSLIPGRWRLLYGLNPMTSVVEGFRWALLGASELHGPLLFMSVGAVILLLLGSVAYFVAVEGTFADTI